ncbi:MAG: DUF1684 domain-containing protein [Thermoplasmata archaeon]|nr:DUF1684 domain-containing protein [Thermoplasmata archaeon]
MDEYEKEVATERRMKDEFMARHPESPFVAETVVGFRGLRYYPIDEQFRVRATLKRLDLPREAFLRTNRDGESTMRFLGELEFTLVRRKLHLRIYHAGEGVGLAAFVPFRDGTSGQETYGPGRYLTLDLNETDEYELDFNRAFNPYCAYTDAYECAFPPAENDLPVPVRAGEMVWSVDRNPRTPNTVVIDMVEKARARTAASRASPPSVKRAPAARPPGPKSPAKGRRTATRPVKRGASRSSRSRR